MWTDISEEKVASICKSEEENKQETAWIKQHNLLAVCFMRVSNFAYFSTLKMEAIYSSEAYVEPRRTTRRYNFS
jgi:hypothetical protein